MRHNVPLHGFGLEVHLKPWLPIAEKSYRRFLHNLADFGLKLHITEFDVNDRLLPASCADRDREVAASARNFLDLALDEKAVVTLITWGLSDRTSWMLHDKSGPRADRLSPRPLPYDAAGDCGGIAIRANAPRLGTGTIPKSNGGVIQGSGVSPAIGLNPASINQKRTQHNATDGRDSVRCALNVAQLRSAGAHNQDRAAAERCCRAGCLTYAQ